MDRPRPVVDPDSAPFWAAARDHRLVVQRCDACGRLRFPLRTVCPACHDPQSSIVDVSGRGRVTSWVVTHQQFHPAFDVPYTVLLVELVEQPGLVMYGNLRPDGDVTAGMAVRACFERIDDELTLVQWERE